MELPTVLEKIAGNGYRAIGAGGLSVGLSAEGASQTEALEKLAELVQARIKKGAEIVSLSVPSGPHPWSQDAGYLRDDPLLGPWRKAMEEARRRLDDEPDES